MCIWTVIQFTEHKNITTTLVAFDGRLFSISQVAEAGAQGEGHADVRVKMGEA